MIPPRASEEPQSRSSARGIAIAAVVVVVGVPAVIGSWIGLIFLAEWWGIALSANQVFSWLIAAVVAVVFWPLALRGARRFLSRRTKHPERPEQMWGTRLLPPVPNSEVTLGDKIGRIATVTLGSVTLILLCGPQALSTAVLEAFGAVSPAAASLWIPLRFLAFVLVLVLLLPVVWITGRQLRKVDPATVQYGDLLVRQNWYVAAVIAWVTSFIVGLLLSWAILLAL